MSGIQSKEEGSGEREHIPIEDECSCPMKDTIKGQDDALERPPAFLPQPEDDLPTKIESEMTPIGPWATGRVTKSPTGGITGVRPVADRYSVTKFGPIDWRAHNQTFFNQSNQKIAEAQLAISNAKHCVERVCKEVDKTQLETRNHLRSRAIEVYRWKSDLEQGIKDINEEIYSLEGERRRVKQSLSVLTIPEAIGGEFLTLRANRLESDLVRDSVEENLTKEVALCSEIRELLIRTREQIEMQLDELKAAKTRMENDWSDKKDAYEIDSYCIRLSNESSVIMWKPGATRFPAEQSTPSSYQHFTREALLEAETVRQRSVNLRSTLDSIYANSIKDLRDQASLSDIAVAEKIQLTDAACQKLEKELLRCLYELANNETTIQELRESTRGLNNAMKLAQTRLSNRLLRKNVESCRDIPQFALIDEVKSVGERVTATLAELKRAEDTQAGLVKARGDLEREIIVKRKTLYIDRQRGQLLRSFYPSAAALSGL